MVHPVELVLALLGATVAIAVLARCLGVPYPVLLTLGGLLLGLQPWTPPVNLDPHVVFVLFLPPLLYGAAFRTEWPDFRGQLRAITLLAVGLVLFTTTLVAAAAHYWVGIPWAAAFVLGAIVSPPDAVAAMAVTQRLRVPRVITTILEGESLVNDASALVALRLAIGALGAGAFSVWEAGGQFLFVSAGGIGIGIVGAHLVIRLHRWLDARELTDNPLTITITLLTPFAVYLPAEHLEVSGVLAVVAAGLWVGSRCEQVFSCDFYDEARAVWEWVEFMLNGLIFILIGLSIRPIIEHLDDQYTFEQILTAAAVVSGVTVVARLMWVYPGAYVPRWLDRRVLGSGDPYPSWREVTVVGWTGMRGVVSLAAALALPRTAPDGSPFPCRELIQFLTFGVIFVTLVGQGLTLPLLIRCLGVTALPGEVAEAEGNAHDNVRCAE
ncbi:na+ h+ antiporter : Na+/H+ antiporter OS=Gloeobacter kilaueensis JS1 GN=GKIL_0560 PE=4 SV=1: Na_H_Exchanger [Gemmataceae bacterium]|nr:na+ h+ antiporter : Na+/H+ antiporter OS=Gloeobacter kilaueensis JS1 GN=GKIL_0560 PE=4 SV=1: Na_H_Exchanger [Gemmataceae bacterium]VTU02714.1 na+ h+ antiporter : Na+/H+ antiporter OS=Gloeobacter kilaueensis JS1 GN=GKIL_0560 PE=4 SV=1: Na_H_Exchanger [Gemmataceae bacterium]